MPEINIKGADIDVLGAKRVVIRNSALAAGDKKSVATFLSQELGPIDVSEIVVDNSGVITINNPKAAVAIQAAAGRALANAADTNYVLCGANYNCPPK